MPTNKNLIEIRTWLILSIHIATMCGRTFRLQRSLSVTKQFCNWRRPPFIAAIHANAQHQLTSNVHRSTSRYDIIHTNAHTHVQTMLLAQCCWWEVVRIIQKGLPAQWQWTVVDSIQRSLYRQTRPHSLSAIHLWFKVWVMSQINGWWVGGTWLMRPMHPPTGPPTCSPPPRPHHTPTNLITYISYERWHNEGAVQLFGEIQRSQKVGCLVTKPTWGRGHALN